VSDAANNIKKFIRQRVLRKGIFSDGLYREDGCEAEEYTTDEKNTSLLEERCKGVRYAKVVSLPIEIVLKVFELVCRPH
jgi:hypothetical protein